MKLYFKHNKKHPWHNQTYTVGGNKFSANPGFTITLSSCDKSKKITALIAPVQKDQQELMREWLRPLSRKNITVVVEAEEQSGYIEFFIPGHVRTICGEGRYGEGVECDKTKNSAQLVICLTEKDAMVG